MSLPIYEYECTACNKRTELLQKVNDPPLEKCLDCDGEVRKLISSAGLHFKGSGWYVTDYAKKKGPSDTSDKKPESKSQKKESTSSKPATESKD